MQDMRNLYSLSKETGMHLVFWLLLRIFAVESGTMYYTNITIYHHGTHQ